MACRLHITTTTGIQENFAMCCLPRLGGLKSSSRVQSGVEQHHCVACVSILALMGIRTRAWCWPILTQIRRNRLLLLPSKQRHTPKPYTGHYLIVCEISWRGVPRLFL